MTYKSFLEDFEQLLSDNKSLVKAYDEINDVPLCEQSKSFYKCWNNKKFSDSLETAFLDCIERCIIQECSIVDVLDDISNSGLKEIKDRTNLQRYFEEIRNIYNKHDNNYDIQFSEENREKLIEMNLKSVISIAKGYQGMGLSLEELISAGNLGLCVAFDKFDPSRNIVKQALIQEINNMSINNIKYEDLVDMFDPLLKYGNARQKFMDSFKPGNTYSKAQISSWINSNIKNARFNSVAMMWIKAYILIELTNNSRTIKKPKAEILKEKETGIKDIYINLDEKVGDSGNNTYGDILNIQEESVMDMDYLENQLAFKENMKKLLDGVKVRDRRILLQKFGIGYPRPMTPKEIAKQENLSIARVSQIIQSVLAEMQENQKKYNISRDVMYEMINNLK